MIRKDREIQDIHTIQEVIRASHCIRLGIQDGSSVYVVPVNFGYEYINDQHIFYFHGRNEGLKTSLIQKNPSIGFELDTNYCLEVATNANHCTAKYQSIIGQGTVEIVDTYDEKIIGLQSIMFQNTKKQDWDFKDTLVEETNVYKILVDKLTGKQYL